MARGFLSGALWGGVLSIGLGAVASVVTPLPPQPQSPNVSDTAPGAGLSPQVSESEAAAVAQATDETSPQSGQTSAQTRIPDADTAPNLDETPVASPKLPTTEIVAGLAPPVEVPATGAIAMTQADPVLPNPQALAPMIPQDADDAAIDTEPAQPPASKVDEIVADESTDQGSVQQTQEDTASEDAPADRQADADVTAEDNTGSSQEPSNEATDQADVTETDEQDSVVSEVPAEAETSDDSGEQIADAPAETTPEVDETPNAPRIALVTPTERPRIGTPAISLTDRAGSVTVNRLGTSAPEAETQAAAAQLEETPAEANSDPRPISQYAQDFDNPDDKPMMSIVLIDDGTNPTAGAAGIAALRSFPYTLNFAVDSSLPDASERMALYRAAGFEVLAMVDLPQGAQPSDVETTFGATLAQMSEVVGVLEGTGVGLQGARDVSDQVSAVLAQSGHGLVTQAKGLNTMPKLARKVGVPAFPVFRDFDSKGQTATVIRRFLDQAAFKAGQEGAVIMLGRMRPDTISALLLWGLQDRAGQVALAPISAVLKREEG